MKSKELLPHQIHTRMMKLHAAGWTKNNPNSDYCWLCTSPSGSIHDLSAACFDCLDEIHATKAFLIKVEKPFDEDTTTVLIKYLNGELADYERRNNQHYWHPAQDIYNPLRLALDDWNLRLPKPTKPYINWDHVAPQFTHLATDATGKSFLYTKKPQTTLHGWFVNGSEYNHVINANVSFASFKPGTCNWDDSLVSRGTSE